MRVRHLRLEHFKCYGEASLDLDRGVTVVHGVNGSGKSTLLEGVFFALYGSKALGGGTLDDVITTGEDEMAVELVFVHGGGTYRVERHVKRRGERATTTKCVLETPDGTIDGARDVRAAIADLLRMDADAFVNCAYVRQGEVNKLIHASPGERQDMIDDLLQLGSLEEYRERASDARLGVKTVLDGQREVLSTVREQVEQKAEKGLHDRLNGLETRLAEVDEEVDRYETQRENARQTLERARDVLERHEETREEIAELDDEIGTLREKIDDTEREREAVADEIRDLEERRADLDEERQELRSSVDSGDDSVEARIETLDAREEALRDELEAVRVSITETSGEIERLREEATALDQQAEGARAEAESLTETIETELAEIERREDKLAALDDDVAAARARFEDAPVAFGEADAHLASLEADRKERVETIGDVTADLRTVESAIEEGERLLEEGKCPECGQPVTDSPHVDVLDEKREERTDLEARRAELVAEREQLDERIERAETLVDAEREVARLEENRETVEALLEEKREALAERREHRDQLREEAATAREDAETKRERAAEREATVDDHREELGRINGERAEIKELLESLERLAEVESECEELTAEVENRRERRQELAEWNDERRETLSKKRERKRSLEADFDEERVESAREDERTAETYLEKVDEKLDDLSETQTNLQNAIGAVERELAELEERRAELDRVADRVDHLESLYEEAETLQETYGDLRSDLRQRNVRTLERLLNETFELVYQNDSYAGIDLDGEYRLTVYQKDGEPLEPEQLSGGERALFNLSLRCAIYRLLAEGVEGAAPMPPLILDEPTVFLDSGHVTQLVSLIESMREMGVEQILVVSHDEELVGAADGVVRVEKDATSNRSRIERDAVTPSSLLAE